MLDWLMELLTEFGGMIVNALPQSPVSRYLGAVEDIPFLSFVNWFVPVAEILVVCQTWLTCIAIYYLYSIILRWIRAIG